MKKSSHKPAHNFEHKQYFTVVFLVLLFTFVPLSSVFAHKIRVFAYENGGEIIAEAKFNNGRPAKNSTVNVMNEADGSLVLQGTTDDQGVFRFLTPDQAKEKRMNLTITVDVGEGHRGSWLLNASDYLGGEEDTAASEVPQSLHLPDQNLPGSDVACAQLEQIIERAVAKELGPIKRMLAEGREEKLKLQDILGGLGYIFGLAGIAAYFHAKKIGR